MRLRIAFASAVLLTLTAGCGTAPPPPPAQACTLIGCSDGLTVVVENAPATPYAVEVALPDGTRRTARCEAGAGCEAGLFFEDVSAEQVTIRITAGAETRSQVVRPSYAETRPNGPDCPPTCRQARVRVRYAA